MTENELSEYTQNDTQSDKNATRMHNQCTVAGRGTNQLQIALLPLFLTLVLLLAVRSPLIGRRTSNRNRDVIGG